ncbi:AzlC family ABC transporter permease [Loktanella sp. TSTF-M6]|uniref:AzlC family ABC transporter permease n=1 Tax=Loktanella gaetbuli TaxID=2881335 RepID=A0ABS8BVZ2_9RHOB|nr:AzlC family ABC transporter permease [Loktanella gaetbuli]MCB5199908.1 AzlC family ABC transporter permease [Loktanella gaetbuli]
MALATGKSAYLQGVRDGMPFLLVAVPFAALFGVSAVEAGLSIGQAMGFSVLVIAGASQFAALQMIVDNAGVALTLLAALAVNLRMAMYSASLVPYLGEAPLWKRACVSYLLFDQSYVAAVARYEADGTMPLRDRVAFFFGVATPIAPTWVLATLAGALLGARIPDAAALDFALPITFIAMVGPMLRTLAHVAAALVSVVVGLALVGLPSGTGLLIAAACAMAAGVIVEGRRA